jgi:ketosteroid isomerase-like protein
MPNIEFLKAFADAWNQQDLDALMSCMGDDGTFISSSGSRAEGAEAVKKAFSSVFEMFPDARWSEDTHFVSGDRGVSEWTFTGTDAEDGEVVTERGCDVFTFKDGKISVKDTFLK